MISLGVLEVDRKEIFRAEEYASRLVAFNNLGYESSFKSDLFSGYLESCTGSCLDDYEGTLYNHDKFFYAIEISPELENIILNGIKNTTHFSIDTIDSTRRIIKLTAYGRHFVKAVFRKDT